MAFKQDDVIKCAEDLSTLIENKEKSGISSMSDYLKSIAGKVEVKGTIIVAIMGSVYVEYIFRYGSLQTPAIVQKNAFYVAVTTGTKVLKDINTDSNWLGAIYSVLSNLTKVIKDLKVTLDEIEEVMTLLDAPEVDFNNINEISANIPLEGINANFSYIAMTMDALNAGGSKSEDGVYKVNTNALLSVFFKNLTISSDSQVNIDLEAKVNIDSDSLVSINRGTLSISGADSALTMESGKIIIEDGGVVTLIGGLLVNSGDTIEVKGEDSSLTISEGELNNSDSCSIIIDGGPLDIKNETFTNNDPIMYVPNDSYMAVYQYYAKDLSSSNYALKTMRIKNNDVLEKRILNNGGKKVVYGKNNIALIYQSGQNESTAEIYSNGTLISTYNYTYSVPSGYVYQYDGHFDGDDLILSVCFLDTSNNYCVLEYYKNDVLLDVVDFSAKIQEKMQDIIARVDTILHLEAGSNIIITEENIKDYVRNFDVSNLMQKDKTISEGKFLNWSPWCVTSDLSSAPIINYTAEVVNEEPASIKFDWSKYDITQNSSYFYLEGVNFKTRTIWLNANSSGRLPVEVVSSAGYTNYYDSGDALLRCGGISHSGHTAYASANFLCCYTADGGDDWEKEISNFELTCSVLSPFAVGNWTAYNNLISNGWYCSGIVCSYYNDPIFKISNNYTDLDNMFDYQYSADIDFGDSNYYIQVDTHVWNYTIKSLDGSFSLTLHNILGGLISGDPRYACDLDSNRVLILAGGKLYILDKTNGTFTEIILEPNAGLVRLYNLNIDVNEMKELEEVFKVLN